MNPNFCSFIAYFIYPAVFVFDYDDQTKISHFGVIWKWISLRETVQIRSFFRSVFSRIWDEYGKIQNRKNSVFGHFSRSVYLLQARFSFNYISEGCFWALNRYKKMRTFTIIINWIFPFLCMYIKKLSKLIFTYAACYDKIGNKVNSELSLVSHVNTTKFNQA